ncbi:MAG: hypothetical protein WD377_07490, partial [Nitriliruptoraceae bacterium]
VNVGDKIEVKVIDIDTVRRRISLSLKQATAGDEPAEESYDEAPEVSTAYSSGGNDAVPSGAFAEAFAQAGLASTATPEEIALAEADVPDEPVEPPAESEAPGDPQDASMSDDSPDEEPVASEDSTEEPVASDDSTDAEPAEEADDDKA